MAGGLPAPGTRRPATAPGRKAVLIGGDCDGLVVRVASGAQFPPVIVVLVDDDVLDTSTAYALSTSAAPPPTAARPVPYARVDSVAGVPAETRVALYVPAEE